MTMTRDEIIRALRCRATDKERNRCPRYQQRIILKEPFVQIAEIPENQLSKE